MVTDTQLLFVFVFPQYYHEVMLMKLLLHAWYKQWDNIE